ncbi:MAG: hypothetical protein ABIT08_05940 [Bacteroidia bacterium]
MIRAFKALPTVQAKIFVVLMSLLISFFMVMAVITFANGSKNLRDLTHASGAVSGIRIIEHQTKSREKTYYEDVLVIGIQGCDDQFGILRYDNNYAAIAEAVSGNKELTAEVYYYKPGGRIEENVTLHVYDLKINSKRYVEIENVSKSEKTSSLVFFLLAVITSLITYTGVKRFKRKAMNNAIVPNAGVLSTDRD